MEKIGNVIRNLPSPTTPKPLAVSSVELTKREQQFLDKFKTGESFLVEFNFDACLSRYSKLKTEELALKSHKLKLREITRLYDQRVPTSLLELWLFNTSKFMAWEMTDQQVRETAVYLYEELYMLNLAELTLFFKKLKKGVYGTFYGKFDGMKICSFAREYRMARGQILSKLPEEEQKRLI